MKKGFTLVELLVVVLVIGVLAAVALPQYRVAVARVRYVQLITLVQSIKQAQEAYYMANGRYSEDFAELDISAPAGGEVLRPGRILYPGGNYLYLQDAKIVGANYTGMCNHYETLLAHSPGANAGKSFCWVAAEAACDAELGEKICKSMGGKQNGGSGNYWLD